MSNCFVFVLMYGLSISRLCSLNVGVNDNDQRSAKMTSQSTTTQGLNDDRELPMLGMNHANTGENISASEELPSVDIDEMSPTSQDAISDVMPTTQQAYTGTDANNDDDEQYEYLNETAFMKILPTMLEYFCVGGHFCFDNENMSRVRFREGKQSCCTECSCTPDCAKTGRCCFQDVVEENFTECVDTVYPKNSQTSTSYRMVTSEKSNANKTNVENCGQMIAGPWGSVNPVFSKSHKRIYKNKFCADAYGVIDGVEWDVIISYSSSNMFPYEAFLSDLSRNEMSTEYRRHFEYPGDDNDVIDLLCGEDASGTSCQRRDFQIPAGIPFSRNEIMTACESGFRSPYQNNLKYSNIFCAVCEMGSRFEHGVCAIEDNLLKGIGKGLVFLIDSSTMDAIESSSESLSQSSLRQLACVADRCRPVLCPFGQVRNSVGECTYVFKNWYNNYYIVQLQLTADQPINVTAAFPMIRGSSQRNIDTLQSPWPAQWLLTYVSCEKETTDGHLITNTLFVILQNYLRTATPSRILQGINKMKNRPWMIKVALVEYTLKADFVWNRNVFSYLGGETLTVQREEHKVSITLPKVLVFYHINYNIQDNVVYINEMYYCNLVELLPTEYERVNTAIFNKISGEFVFNGYFYQHYGRLNLSVKVCLDSSGLYVSESKAKSFDNNFLCILWSVGWIYVILWLLLVA